MQVLLLNTFLLVKGKLIKQIILINNYEFN